MSEKRISKLKEKGMVRKGTFIVNVAKTLKAQAVMNERTKRLLFGKSGDGEGDRRRKAIAEADRWFSQFIRLRDSDANGIATCVTSGKRAHWTTMDCGHYVSRAKQSTRYDEQNCHAQSKMSNRFQGGHFVEHGNRIDELHGKGTAEKLRQKGLQRCSRTTSDYLFLADCYKKKVAQIALNEPGKFKKP